jgi:1,4-dihydroxy-2-naphthoate octaprenyltransferase
VGAASITAAVAYTAGPYPLGYKGLGDVFVFVFFGLVAVGLTFYLQTQRWTWEAAALAVAQGCLSVNLLVITSYRDIDTDVRCGKKTLGVRWGRRFLEGQYLCGFLIPMGIVAVFAMHYRYSLAMLLPWVLFPMGYSLISDLRRLQERFDFDRGLKTTAFIMMAYAVLVATALWVSR